jgi:hypothetical protein
MNNKKQKAKNQITARDVEHWIGCDATREQIFNIIAEIANGRYKPALLSEEIRSCE